MSKHTLPSAWTHFIQPSFNKVEAWSSERLPFQAQGWRVELRDELRTSIGALHCGGNLILDGTYASLNTEYFDVENVLFYNLSSGCFGNSARNGIRFQRLFGHPPAMKSGRKAPHYQSYTLVKRAEPFHIRRRQTLAEWSRIPLDKGLRNPEAIWCSIKSNTARMKIHKKNKDRWFGLRLILHPSQAAHPSNLTSIMKPVFDGAISAFHNQEDKSKDRTEIVKRLQAKLPKVSNVKLQEYLDSETEALLGERQLVSLFRKGIKWDPADDKCMAGELLIGEQSSGSHLELTGELYGLEKALPFTFSDSE